MLVYIVYSKSKIHGVYSDKGRAEMVQVFLEKQGEYTDGGVPKRFYYIDTVELDTLPNKMTR